MSTRWLFWTLAADLCIFKTYHAYVLCSLHCQQFIGIHLLHTARIFAFLSKKKALFVDFPKWSVESRQKMVSFCLFIGKSLTSEPRRKFSTHVMIVFWVPKMFSRIRAIQRTLNQVHTTRTDKNFLNKRTIWKKTPFRYPFSFWLL